MSGNSSLNSIYKYNSTDTIKVKEIDTWEKENPTDMLTKLVQSSKFMHCLDLLNGGMRSSRWASTVRRVFNPRGRTIEFRLNTLCICASSVLQKHRQNASVLH
jgi:hypothetical protein